MKQVITQLLFIGLLFFHNATHAQNIGGVVNRYTSVTNFEGCAKQLLTVGSAQGFGIGDEVLIIQMQGATINQSNTSAFGDILDLGHAGDYELNRIAAITGNQIELQFKPTNDYKVAGKVQLIRVPEYGDVTVTSDLTCQPWNGTTGGVLAIDVSGTLTLQSNLNVSAKGFRGGVVVDANAAPFGELGYFYAPNPVVSAQKGEGIAIIPLDKSFGRGKAATGGGGGNSHNAGGGGGGNFGAGGFGGLEYYNVPGTPTPGTNGIGGVGGTGGLRMGGGGGAGHTNDDHGSSGGLGGGIIVLKANIIQGNSKNILADGESVISLGTDRNDGQGGGGAGGTLQIQANQLIGNVTCSANGGKGGDCLFYVQSQIIGPGGGGGGGIIGRNLAFPGMTMLTNGGDNGIANQNLTNGATKGGNGFKITGGLIAQASQSPQVETTQTIVLCPGETINLGGQSYVAPATVNLTLPGFNGDCDTLATYTLLLKPQVSINETIALCPGETTSLGGQTYTAPATVNLTLPGFNGDCDTLATYTVLLKPQVSINETIALCPGETASLGGQTYTAPATVNLTLPGFNGDCDTLATYILLLKPQVSINETIDLCPGETTSLGGQTYTAPATVNLTLSGFNGDCDTLATYTLQLITPAPSMVSITCPGNISVVTVPGTGSVVVNYPNPTAASDCPCPGLELGLNSGLPSGSLFPPTSTSVCWQASDSCGQTATCCFVVTVREEAPCDTKTNGCMKYELLSITADAGQNRTYRIRVTNNCANKMSYTAIQIPDGVMAMSPANNTIYTDPVSGREYLVRSPNFSPMYSVRFTSTTDSISGGQSEVFRYKLPAQAAPTYINIRTRLEPQVFYEAHLNTFNCPIGVTPAGERPAEARETISSHSPEIRLFPNPTSGVLFADLSDWAGEDLQLRVMDSRGQLVLHRSINANSTAQELELPGNLPSGLYFLDMVTHHGEKYTIRFALQR